ncbi:MAG TPA: hypothetical protein DHV26_17875 [Cytophagales bacterium]|nr:hypothetical protein [Cytophagales bacterium]HRG11001.1 hypothetical protein [Cyclobacteriaceae bacterium]
MKNVWITVLCLMACSSEISDLFSSAKEKGIVDIKLEEASGLVASAAHPGYFWTHNDSGNGAQLFLIDSTANIAATMPLGAVRNRDWEDITLGPGPDPDKTYVYVGDIGDNKAQYPYKIIYRLEEPTAIENKTIEHFDTLFVQLPDGTRDSEALMIDPISSRMFMVSKREDSVRLYQFPNTWKSGDTLTAELKIKMPYNLTVAADISFDGSEVLLKNYDHVYYWKREGTEPIADLLQRTPLELRYKPEKQGEAIAWSRDGSGYYTLSESSTHERARLLFYKRK